MNAFVSPAGCLMRWMRSSPALQILRRGNQCFDQPAEGKSIPMNLVPECFVEQSFVFQIPHFSSKEKGEMRVDDRANEPFLSHSLQRKCLQSLALERIRRDQLLITVIDGQPVLVVDTIAAVIIPA